MVKFNLTYGHNISLEQRVVFEVAARILGTYVTDDTSVDVHVLGATGLNDGNAVGGAVPLFHKVHYGVLKEYLEQDASSYVDDQSVLHMQNGNTVDLSAYGDVINGNTEILLTRAQAEALGMDESLLLSDGSTWDKDTIDIAGLDGYLVVNQDFAWNNDVLRTSEVAEDTLDTLSMAIHELTHVMGFVSGIDGTININELLSGELAVEGTTLFDLRRFTASSAELENPDGSVSSITEGEAAYLSADGGKTSLGELSTGQNKEIGGDGYQASHWKRMQVAMGIMDPTLAYKEQLNLSERDLQALDLLGWDVDYSQLNNDLDIESLLVAAEQSVAASFGLDSNVLTEHRAAGNIYTMGFSEWWQLFEKQIIEMGFSEWWQVLEAGYESWEEFQDNPDAMLNMGFSEWWQSFEVTVLNMGFSEWWQTFESDMLHMGFSEWWQLLEMGFSEWWQQIDTYFSTLEESGNPGSNDSGAQVIDHSDAEGSVVVSGGDADDILAGSHFRDLVSGGGGDDLIDGKDGADNILGESGNDILYGFSGDDKLYGGDGDDFLAGEDDNDQLYGEAGHDILSGGFGNDIIDGAADNDVVKGDAGKDVLDGGTGDDNIDGGDDRDIAIGGEGKDIVSGGRGDDVLYGDQYQGNSEEQSASLEEISKQAEFTSAVQAASIDFWVRLEAEDLQLRHFNTDESAIASGNGLISTGGRGEAKGKFSGPTGIYDIIVGYYDEKDGKGELKVEIGQKRDKQKFEWTLDEDLKDHSFSTTNFTTRTIRGIHLESGEDIKIKGESEGEEFIRLDYLDIISTTESTPFAEAQFYNGSFYLESQTKSIAEANALGGQLIAAEKYSAEEYWLKNTIGKTKDIIRVDVSDSQFNVLQDAATRQAADNAIRIEAESFDLSGSYKVENRNDFASGKSVIVSSGSRSGKATTLFTGESGLYDIFVSYIDEKKKEARASFGINGQTLDEWSFNALENTAGYRSVGTQVELTAGDYFEIEGWADGSEKAAIDYIELVAVTGESESDLLQSAVAERQGLTVEAESLSWSGKAKEKDEDYASEGLLIEGEKSAYTKLTFTGESGLYNINIGYDDEGKGEGEIIAWRGNNWNSYIDSWKLDVGEKDAINTQTLATEILLTNGEQLTLQTGDKKIHIDYIDFTPVKNTTTAINSGMSTDESILIEAESMYLTGTGSIGLGSASKPSGDYFVSLIEASISTLFQGETGYYDVVVSYFDNGDYSTQMQFEINGLKQDLWKPTHVDGESAFVERTVASSVLLTKDSDSLRIWGDRLSDSGTAYIDYIKLIKVDSNEESTLSADSSTNSDILRGGEGNDLIYGGEGNDLIYGEDEFDSGLSQASESSDTLFGGAGDDTLYGNSGNDTLYGDDDSEPVFVKATPTTENGVIYNGSEYLLTNSRVDWDTAQAQAEALGGNLVTINNADEEAWLRSQFSGTQSFWLGINDRTREGDFEWASGETVSYTNWKGNGPDNYYNQDYGVIEWTGAEGSQWQDHYDTGGWEYRNNNWQWQYGYRGIIEIERPELVIDDGNGGNDRLEGGRGNDTLKGGVGADILDGSDAIAAGHSEKDILEGGLGTDTFVIGSAHQAYYIGNGEYDYAVIEDFNSAEDVVQLHGSAGDYTQQKHGNDTYLSYQSDTSDLVAIFKNIHSVDLNTGFTFV